MLPPCVGRHAVGVSQFGVTEQLLPRVPVGAQDEGCSGWRCEDPAKGNTETSYFAAVGCIPLWYCFGMSTQIAVRLPDDLVAFVDDLVSHGDAASRAAVVSRALERERRRRVAERDAAILAIAGRDTDLDSLAEYAAATSMDDLA